MRYQALGRTGFSVSRVSFGAWAAGGDFGTVSDQQSLAALRRAVDLGVNFFDTADVYGDGRSERLLGQLKRQCPQVFIATKAGRRLKPHLASGYTLDNLRAFVERSLRNLQSDSLDLLQLHCPPTDTYYQPETFEALERLAQEGKIKHYGVSVERVEEALRSLDYPGVKTVQVIYNILRQRPADVFFAEARRREVGVIARLPLSSGLLGGKITATTQFETSDHRNYNLHGRAFDRGETFSGIDLDVSLPVVAELRRLLPKGWTMAQLALRWILMQEAVSCVIPGAKRAEQVEENVSAADLPELPPEAMLRIAQLYNNRIKPVVHHRW
jgi:aryl-alcohol dehydrogenase-like predicted oxidoreductase